MLFSAVVWQRFAILSFSSSRSFFKKRSRLFRGKSNCNGIQNDGNPKPAEFRKAIRLNPPKPSSTFSEDEIHKAATFHMGFWTFAVIENLSIIAARIHQCIGKNWHSSESLFLINRPSKVNDV